MSTRVLDIPVNPDWQAFLRCILRERTPRRVHHVELFLDLEVQQAICDRFDLLEGLDPADPFFGLKRQVALQRYLGYDYVVGSLEGFAMPVKVGVTDDTAELGRARGRSFKDEHEGPITTWQEFDTYPWPDPDRLSTRALDWYEANLPPDMCVIGGLCAHFCEFLTWLMGYEGLCYALHDQRDLVEAVYRRLLQIETKMVRQLLQFERVKVVWGSDDMGFRTGTLISPRDLREFVLPGHRLVAQMAHDAGRPYLLHSCGNITEIMSDLLDDVRIDARHSFEDTIETVVEAKAKYGGRIALLGGIDVDFLCRSSEQEVRRRVRETLDVCLPGGGYCLGTGNSVANYIPLDNFLAMLDEGRRYS